MRVATHLFKLSFPAGVSFGGGRLSDSPMALRADTLFSALCIESLRRGGSAEELAGLAKSGGLLLSDGFPYGGGKLYGPKPFVRPQGAGRSKAKRFKERRHIPLAKMRDYADGKLDEADCAGDSDFGETELATKAAVSRTGEAAKPYNVRAYRFRPGAGLYFLAVTKDAGTRAMLESLMESLSATGIGGKKSAGYGRFSVEVSQADELRLGGEAPLYVSLSVGLPKDGEMEAALDGAGYGLVKRSGFVASADCAEGFARRRDLFAFASGSVFRARFEGDVYDVGGGGHPVYLYAKPVFLGLG